MIVAILRRMFRRFDPTSRELVVLDHVPIQAHQSDLVIAARAGATTRAEKIAAARARYGRAFRCAATDQDREVLMTPGTIRIVRAGHQPTAEGFKPEPAHSHAGVFALDARSRRR